MSQAEQDIEDLRGVAAEVRMFLEERWSEIRLEYGVATPMIASHDMCRFSACFLLKRLEDAFPGESWEAQGGDSYYEPGGLKAADGRWRDHYWVVSMDRGLIVDVTADQFGYEPVLVVADDDGRFLANMPPEDVYEHFKDVRDRVAIWRDLAREAAAAGGPRFG